MRTLEVLEDTLHIALHINRNGIIRNTNKSYNVMENFASLNDKISDRVENIKAWKVSFRHAQYESQ